MAARHTFPGVYTSAPALRVEHGLAEPIPAPPPVILPPTGDYFGTIVNTITDAFEGVMIHFTVDSSAPSTESPVYTGSFITTNDRVVRAYATGGGYLDSAIAQVTYHFPVPAAPPVILPASGTYVENVTATITDSSPGVSIYYTVNGSNPDVSSLVYNSPIFLDVGTWSIKAFATGGPFLADFLDSPVVEANYAITDNSTLLGSLLTEDLVPILTEDLNYFLQIEAGTGSGTGSGCVVDTPVISPVSGYYTSAQNISITSSTPGAAIYYTLEGTNPTASDTPYTGTFLLDEGTWSVKSVAIKAPCSDSAVATNNYVVDFGAFGSLSQLTWKIQGNCNPGSFFAGPAPSPADQNETLSGTPGVLFDVTLRFRGIVELKGYSGGTPIGTYAVQDGTPAADSFNVYSLVISNPSHTYYLNKGAGGYPPAVLDYQVTITISEGALVTLHADTVDNTEVCNGGGQVITPGIDDPPIVTPQPYYGQFLQMDVVSVVPH